MVVSNSLLLSPPQLRFQSLTTQAFLSNPQLRIFPSTAVSFCNKFNYRKSTYSTDLQSCESPADVVVSNNRRITVKLCFSPATTALQNLFNVQAPTMRREHEKLFIYRREIPRAVIKFPQNIITRSSLFLPLSNRIWAFKQLRKKTHSNKKHAWHVDSLFFQWVLLLMLSVNSASLTCHTSACNWIKHNTVTDWVMFTLQIEFMVREVDEGGGRIEKGQR
jgi:hypothetical protein